MKYRFFCKKNPINHEFDCDVELAEPIPPDSPPWHLLVFLKAEVRAGLEYYNRRRSDKESAERIGEWDGDWTDFIYEVIKNPQRKLETDVGNAYMLSNDGLTILVTCYYEDPENNTQRFKAWELLRAIFAWKEYRWAVSCGRREPFEIEIEDEGWESRPDLGY
ncbi:hypothetical protein [Meiothermus taiwanensis]|uniref:hypothetical protein n=1 Tax=Meiothermus taiwanensis TaxID=172827 RepID=UPI0003FA45C4